MQIYIKVYINMIKSYEFLVPGSRKLKFMNQPFINTNDGSYIYMYTIKYCTKLTPKINIFVKNVIALYIKLLPSQMN